MRRGCPDMFRVSCEGISRGPPRVFVWWVVILSTESPNAYICVDNHTSYITTAASALVYTVGSVSSLAVRRDLHVACSFSPGQIAATAPHSPSHRRHRIPHLMVHAERHERHTAAPTPRLRVYAPTEYQSHLAGNRIMPG